MVEWGGGVGSGVLVGGRALVGVFRGEGIGEGAMGLEDSDGWVAAGGVVGRGMGVREVVEGVRLVLVSGVVEGAVDCVVTGGGVKGIAQACVYICATRLPMIQERAEPCLTPHGYIVRRLPR